MVTVGDGSNGRIKLDVRGAEKPITCGGFADVIYGNWLESA